LNNYPIDEVIFNMGVKMASEFGENFMKPIQDRLMLQFAFLSRDHVDFYNQICIEARDEAHNFVYNQMEKLAAKRETISKTWSYAQFEVHMKAKYPLMNEANLQHLYSQGCYYCWKDGIITPLEND
jgi:hypothetical protein